MNVLIDAGNPHPSLVMLDIDTSLTRLTIDADDSVFIEEGRSLGVFGDFESFGTIVNAGAIHLRGQDSPSHLLIDYPGEVTVTGGGTIILTDAQRSRILSQHHGALLNNIDNSIQGAGLIGGGMMGLKNGVVIDANQPYETLLINPDESGAINTGLMQASNQGRLGLSNSVFNNTTGEIRALTGSRVDLDGSTVIGGLLSTSGNGLIRAMYSPAAWHNVTNQGTFELGPVSLTVRGTIINDGTMSLVAGDTVAPPAPFSEVILPVGAGDVYLQGAGTMTLLGSKIHSGTAQPAGRLIHGSQHTIAGEGMLGCNTVALTNHGTIIADQSSAIVFDPPDGQKMINTGLLRAESPAGFIMSGGEFQNDGVIEVLDGSRCIYNATATEVNVMDGALMTGTWRVLGSESTTILLIPGPSIFYNEADVTLSGSGSMFTLMNTMIGNYGSFTLADGRDFEADGPMFNNSGELTIGSGCTFTATEGFTQDPDGVLRIEVGSSSVNPAASALVVNGTALLDATLDISLADGFHPISGQTLHLISASSIAGEFDTIVAPSSFQVSYLNDQVIVSVAVPCPSDIDGSGEVDIPDLYMMFDQWGKCPSPSQGCACDLDPDGVVCIEDLLVLLANWGPCP